MFKIDVIFARIRIHNMWLHPSNWGQRGIEVFPEKLNAIIEMRSPTFHKKLQCLNACLSTLRRILSKSEEKSSFFVSVPSEEKIWVNAWMWRRLCHLRTLQPPAKLVYGNALFHYLSINPLVVRSLLIKEEDKGQVPIYYVSKVLSKVEINYL